MTTPAHLSLALPDEAATLALGAALAPGLKPGMSVHLRGDLGSGKTTLVRGILRALGFAGRVKSPTFAIVEPYEISSLYLYHFDFYRFRHTEEWASGGFRDYFNETAVCLIEWPDKVAGKLPAPDLVISLQLAETQGTNGGRDADIGAHTEAGTACLTGLA